MGYTDSTTAVGSEYAPVAAARQQRASALITQGVAANHIRTSGMGPANPIASNTTAEGKRKTVA